MVAFAMEDRLTWGAYFAPLVVSEVVWTLSPANRKHNERGTLGLERTLKRLYRTVLSMPRPGYHTITIPDSVYAKLAELAKQQNNTVPRIIANLVNTRTHKLEGRRIA